MKENWFDDASSYKKDYLKEMTCISVKKSGTDEISSEVFVPLSRLEQVLAAYQDSRCRVRDLENLIGKVAAFQKTIQKKS